MAIAEGTITATTVIATMASVRSNAGLKPLMRLRPGMNREMPVGVGGVTAWVPLSHV